MPDGIELASDGTLSGTATEIGDFTFTVEVTDGLGDTATEKLTLTVNYATITVSTSSLGSFTAGTEVTSSTLTASGGDEDDGYTFSILTGSLPTGLEMADDGTITGTSTEVGSSVIGLVAEDSLGYSGILITTITVASADVTVSASDLDDGTAGDSVSATFSASGGYDDGGYTYTVSSSTVPTGLTFSTTGTLSGTLEEVGTFSFIVTVEDDYGSTGSESFEVTVSSATLTISDTALASATAGSTYSTTLSATGGSDTYTYALATGSELPAGLELASGVISGTPTAVGCYSFTINVTDSYGSTGVSTLYLEVQEATLTVSATLGTATANTAYSASFSTTGGSGTYTYSLDSGTMPTGLTLSNDGKLTGTPTHVGTSTFTVAVEDSNNSTASAEFALTVVSADLTISPSSLPTATLNSAYSVTFVATGGNGDYDYKLGGADLPDGLSFSGTTLSGTPTTAGSTELTMTVTDTNGSHASISLTLVVSALPDPTEDA